jgi:hypothetical protein
MSAKESSVEVNGDGSGRTPYEYDPGLDMPREYDDLNGFPVNWPRLDD